jgi:phosphoribosylformylglycinamidine (FGAM) synthase-like enzyme
MVVAECSVPHCDFKTSDVSEALAIAADRRSDSILKAKPDAALDTLPQLLESMCSLAVIPIATGVLRTELLQLRQERDETFRAFTARVRGKAEMCAFATVCECGKSVDYTNHAIRDVLLNGIYDTDICRYQRHLEDLGQRRSVIG